MPRINIYLNEKTHKLVNEWKDRFSLSDVFSRSLRDEIAAIKNGRDIRQLAQAWKQSSEAEQRLEKKFSLKRAILCENCGDAESIRSSLGRIAATYVDFLVTDGMEFRVCGGRQIWEVVRNLNPRRVQVVVKAYGIEFSKTGVQHVHSNTLATILSLLYQPRSAAELIVANTNNDGINNNDSLETLKQRQVVLGSCSVFEPSSEFANLLGRSATRYLERCNVTGEFGYTFWDKNNSEHILPNKKGMRCFSRSQLELLSRDFENDVILVAGGGRKRLSVLQVLHNRMCNVLVTTQDDAMHLLLDGACNDS